ncbi:phage major capsid protein [Georgenia sp. AZ-5]|uniref:phage major capsid protein n=1 Tax=Georgenia sp. AZ-5 TaxID=3367526 RepID=UPI003755194D
MTNTTSSASAILRPEDVHELLVRPALNMAVVGQERVSTLVRTNSTTYRVPLVTADPTAEWVAEGQEITPTDMTLAEVNITPKKLAGLSIITRELADDSSPDARRAVGEGLARDMARKLDTAFLSVVTDPDAPDGIADLTGTTNFNSGAATWTNLDAFARAVSNAADVGARITAFLMHPSELLALTQLKEGSGSNKPLLGPDPTVGGATTVFGTPIYVSSYLATGVVYGVDRTRVLLVVRDDAKVETDSSVFFTSDRLAVKATMRVGFGFTHPASVVKITRAV